GGFYAYDHEEDTKRAGTLCEGRTDDRGRLACEGRPPAEGRLVVQATVTDPDGHQATAADEVWVVGTERWWFDVESSDRIDVLPEQRRSEPGETARFQVRMPFREATALVTIERDGIVDTTVVPLAGTAPVIELPVKPEWAPNVVVSVLVVRGR